MSIHHGLLALHVSSHAHTPQAPHTRGAGEAGALATGSGYGQQSCRPAVRMRVLLVQCRSSSTLCRTSAKTKNCHMHNVHPLCRGAAR